MASTETVVQNVESRRDRIINIINNTVAAYCEKSNRTSVTLYQEEPIIKTAAQLNNYTPDKIINMRRLAAEKGQSPQELFYKQGVFMSDFEDDYYRPEDVKRVSYRYPTYQSMRDKDLRMYFTWRSKVRRTGQIEEYVHSFVMLYIYEILNLIGFNDSYSAFCEFLKVYNVYNDSVYLGPYLHIWYRDFVVYYNLDFKYLAELPLMEKQSSLWCLLDIKSDDETLFDAICNNSHQNIKSSPGYKKSRQMYLEVVCDSYRRLYTAKRAENKSFVEELFDPMTVEPVHLFSGAVFFQKKRINNYSYGNELYQLICKDNKWYSKSFNTLFSGKTMDSFIKFIDYQLRAELNVRTFKSKPHIPPDYIDHIHDAIIAYKLRQQELLRPKISIDTSRLGDIRRNADITMHKLIVEEEETEENSDVIPDEVVDTFCCGVLDDKEVKLIKLLLCGDCYDEFLRENKLLLSVVVDSINEKLFETLQDTAIVTDGDKAELVDDYYDTLKGLVY